MASIKGKTSKFNSSVFIIILFNIYFLAKARLRSKRFGYYHFTMLPTQIKVLNSLTL
jgi:hypothetical protein